MTTQSSTQPASRPALYTGPVARRLPSIRSRAVSLVGLVLFALLFSLCTCAWAEDARGAVREWAEVPFVPSRAGEKRDTPPYRYLAIRVRAPQGMLFGDAHGVKHFAVVTNDGTIRVMEAELMRMVGAVLDCPLPPLLETVDPATLAA